MRIGIIGSGNVAVTLAKGFVRHGHEVLIGTRDPGKLDDLRGHSPGVHIGSLQDASAFAELAVLAVKGSAAIEALRPLAAALAHKVVIDATNPIADGPPENGVIRFFTGPNDSLGERIQKAYPALRVVKAFNSVGSPFMVNPTFPGATPTMFIAGNDAAAKRDVSAVVTQFGWEACDMGPIEASRALEPLCQLWCIPGFLRNEWNHAFKLVRG